MLELPDLSAMPAVVLPSRTPVVVGRRGDKVTVRIGNADLRPMGYDEAFRTGQYLINQGGAARRAGERLARLAFGHHHVECSPRVLIRVGHWILTKASEAKLLAGDHARRVFVE
jgi:hypothetical protein